MKHLFLIFAVSIISVNSFTQELGYSFNSEIELKKSEKLVESPYAIFGDNTTVLQTKHEEEKDHTLKIPIVKDEKEIGLFELDFQTGIIKAKNEAKIVFFQKKLTKEELARFTSIDPLAEKYYSWSPYVYVMNNPMKYIDPNGMATYVIQNADGTYRVVGGNKEDGDLNIYAFNWDSDGKYTGMTTIGQTTSQTSFYNDTENPDTGKDYGWMGAIDPNDMSGQNFLDDLASNEPLMQDYMDNAKGGQKYDFKTTNGTNSRVYSKQEDLYRGMPVTLKNGQKAYTSARDIGNIGAGYMAGIYSIPWSLARKEFDKLQSAQEGGTAVEGASTQNAQRVGWTSGYRSAPSSIGKSMFTRWPHAANIYGKRKGWW